MIGNDIVDLKLAKTESNWQRKGFLDKIFTNQEQNYINDSAVPELMVWNLWSRKEAAYKIWNRSTKIKLFNPIKFECGAVCEKTGIVIYENNQYYTKTDITKNFVYTIAADDLKLFKQIKSAKKPNIIKENGIPYLDFVGNSAKIISITHHGRFEKIIMI